VSASLTDSEWAFLSHIPEGDLVDLAVDLDIVAPAVVDGRELLERCIPPLLARFATEGLPLSKYDREDIVALPEPHRAAIAGLLGLPPDASIDRILRVGQRVYRAYRKQAGDSPVALLLPSLLPALARIAAEAPR
jgi:hypothetical protein